MHDDIRRQRRPRSGPYRTDSLDIGERRRSLSIASTVSAVFVLLSCSPREGPDGGAVARTGNIASDLLMKLPGAQQAMHLGHMVDGCDGIRAFYMGIDNKDNIASWSVGCSDGSSYSIGIENDAAGTATVLDCRALKAVADVDCFVSFAAQANRAPRTSEQFMCAVANLPRSLREQVLRQFVKTSRHFFAKAANPFRIQENR